MDNFNLYDIDADKASLEKLQEIVKHIQDRCRNTHQYLVGEWNNGHRAISTRNGKFVENDEVIEYLKKTKV